MKFEIDIPDYYVEIVKSWVIWNKGRQVTNSEVIQQVLLDSYLSTIFGLNVSQIIVNERR